MVQNSDPILYQIKKSKALSYICSLQTHFSELIRGENLAFYNKKSKIRLLSFYLENLNSNKVFFISTNFFLIKA